MRGRSRRATPSLAVVGLGKRFCVNLGRGDGRRYEKQARGQGRDESSGVQLWKNVLAPALVGQKGSGLAPLFPEEEVLFLAHQLGRRGR